MHRYCAANNALRYMQYKALQWRHARAPFFRGFGLAIHFAGEQRTAVLAAEEDDGHEKRGDQVPARPSQQVRAELLPSLAVRVCPHVCTDCVLGFAGMSPTRVPLRRTTDGLMDLSRR